MTTSTPDKTGTWLDGIELDTDDDDFAHISMSKRWGIFRSYCGMGKGRHTNHSWICAEDGVNQTCSCGAPVCPECINLSNYMRRKV